MAASPGLAAVVQAFNDWYDRCDGDTLDLAFVAEAGCLALAKAFEGQAPALGKTQPSPSQGLTTWPDFDEDGLPNGAVCIGQDGSAIGLAFNSPDAACAVVTANFWSMAQDMVEALSAMMIFDHPGLSNLVLKCGPRHGWTQADYSQQRAAVRQARRVIAKANGFSD